MITKNDIKRIRSLHQKKYRDENRLFIVENPKIIAELLAEKHPIDRLFLTDKAPEYLKKWPFEQIKMAELERISTLKNPSFSLAVLPYIDEQEIPLPKGDIFIGLDDIKDPGNFGTIVRICDWFGIDHLICSEGSVDKYNTKVVQASMGGVFRVNIHYTNLNNYCKRLIDNNIEILSASLTGEPINTIKAPQEGLLFIGNESNGVSNEIAQMTTKELKIQGFGKAESLNASVACGILANWLKS